MKSQKENSQFLEDIESLLNNSLWSEIRCIVLNIESVDNQNIHILELSGIEIENFKITGKIFWIHIKPEICKINDSNNLSKTKYYDYDNYDGYYVYDSKNQLQKFINFIGNDSYLIFHDISDYYLLENEIKFWNLPNIEKYRLRSTYQIGNKILKLKKEESIYSLDDFCFYYEIKKYKEDVYINGLYNCAMTAKLFIRLYDDFYKIYNELYLKETINKNDLKINKHEIVEIGSLIKESDNIKLKEKDNEMEKNTHESFITKFKKINLNENENEGIRAYIYDSYNNSTRFYECYFEFNKSKKIIKGKVDNTSVYFKSGSGGAVLFGCTKVIEEAIKLGIKKLDIFTSLIYIRGIMEEGWNKKSDSSREFGKFVDSKKQEIEVHFYFLSENNIQMQEAKKYCMQTANNLNIPAS